MRKYLFIIAALTLFSSCLDENPRDRIEEEEAINSANALYLNAVANLYNYIGGHNDCEGLQGTTRGVYDLQTFTSDLELSLQGHRAVQLLALPARQPPRPGQSA